MMGVELAAIREKLGVGLVEMGAALGYQGSGNTVGRLMRRFESDGREIPPHVAAVVRWYDRHGLVANVREPAHPRVYLGKLLHGDRAAVLAYGMRPGADRWLSTWFYRWDGWDERLHIALMPRVGDVGVVSLSESASVATIQVQTPIITPGSDPQLLGARLTVQQGGDALNRWLKENPC